MANNFPVLAALQVASLQYSVKVAGIAGPVNSIPTGTMNLIAFEFQGAPVAGVLQFDYSGFDQDTHEAGVRTLLNGICAAMAGNLAVPLATVQAAMTVTRTWVMEEAAQVAGNFAGITVTDVMPYP